MKVLVADAFPERARADLTERGHDCVYDPDLASDDLPGHVKGYDVLVVRSTRVAAQVFEDADDLRMVIRAGSGTNTIDCDAATRRDIAVCNVPGGNAVAVAELAFGLLLALDRNVPDNVADLRAGRWDKKRYSKARGILGRKIGVVGLGQIGLAFAERAAAFGADVFAVAKAGRPPRTVERAAAIGVSFVDSLPALAERCDVLSFHVPAVEGTRHLIDEDLLAHVQQDAIILNTSRADIVDEAALLDALESKGVRAGLDVVAGEPGSSTGEIDSPLVRHPNVYATHHIGASTEQAQEAIAAEVVRMVTSLDAGEVLHCVNLGAEPTTAAR